MIISLFFKTDKTPKKKPTLKKDFLSMRQQINQDQIMSILAFFTLLYVLGVLGALLFFCLFAALAFFSASLSASPAFSKGNPQPTMGC